MTTRPPFGDPPPKYPATIVAVRKRGEIVTGDDAVGPASEITFDISINTTDGLLDLEDVGSHCVPPANDVDVNVSGMENYIVEVWYIKATQTLHPMIPLREDSADCDDIQ